LKLNIFENCFELHKDYRIELNLKFIKGKDSPFEAGKRKSQKMKQQSLIIKKLEKVLREF